MRAHPSSSHGPHVTANGVSALHPFTPAGFLKTAASSLNSAVQQFEDYLLFTGTRLSRTEKVPKMPASLCGTWEMISNVNMEGYMIALGMSLKHVVIQQCSLIMSDIKLGTFAFPVLCL